MMDRRNNLYLLRPNLHGVHTSHYHNLSTVLRWQVNLNIVYVVL